jgi:hypothetical protein
MPDHTIDGFIHSSECPLCGDSNESVLAGDSIFRRQSQVRRLTERLKELETGQITVEQLRQRIARLCGMCQMLMIGLSSPADQLELAERVRKEIDSLMKNLRDLQNMRRAA